MVILIYNVGINNLNYMPFITCLCGEKVKIIPSQLKRKKYCSKKCFYKYKKRPKGLKYNIKVKNKGWFKKGHPKPQNAYKWEKGEKHPMYKTGNGYIDSSGYKRIHEEKFEHREIAKELLGNYFNKKSEVHHDRERDNNNPKYLKYFRNGSAHHRLHHFCRRHNLKMEDIPFNLLTQKEILD